MHMLRESRAVLANRQFRALFSARTVSVVGNAVAPVALAFGVLGLHGGSATSLGLVLFARSLAQVGCLLLAGVIADRFPRYWVMVGSDLLAGSAQVCVAAMFLTGAAHLPTIAVLEAVNGAAAAFFLPASTGLLPQVVEQHRLQPANAVLRLSTNSSTILGAAIAGVLVATVGPGWALMGDALSFFCSAALLAGIRVSHSARGERTSLLADLRSGWREFASRQWVWVIVVQFAVVNACYSGGINVLGPLVSKRHLGGALAWAAIVAASSVGMLIGALVIMRLRPRYPMRVATFATFAYAAPLFLLAWPAPVWLIVVVAVGVGICSDIFGVLWDTGLQTLIPQEALSRVSSYDALGSFALGPLGLAIVGPLSSAIGVRETLIGAGIIVVLCCAGALLSPEVRTLQLHKSETQPPVP
jgi:MFS family permease